MKGVVNLRLFAGEELPPFNARVVLCSSGRAIAHSLVVAIKNGAEAHHSPHAGTYVLATEVHIKVTRECMSAYSYATFACVLPRV